MYTFIHSFSHCGGSVFKVKFPVYDKIRTLKARFFSSEDTFQTFQVSLHYIQFVVTLLISHSCLH